MKKTSIIFCFLLTINSLFAQNINKRSVDVKKNMPMLVGHCDKSGLQQEPFKFWFDSTFQTYSLDKQTLDKIHKDKLANIKCTIIMATWCGDSREQVPHFYKIMEYLKFDADNISLVCVDRSKTAEGIDIQSYKIELVPTFIFFSNEVEIGRIIETPKETIEKDLLNILSK